MKAIKVKFIEDRKDYYFLTEERAKEFVLAQSCDKKFYDKYGEEEDAFFVSDYHRTLTVKKEYSDFWKLFEPDMEKTAIKTIEVSFIDIME